MNCKISDFDMWNAKHLVQTSCTGFTITQNSVMMIFCENPKMRLPRSWCTINALWPSQRKNCKSRENARFGLHNVWLELKTSSYLLPHFCNFPPPFLLHGLVYVLSTCVPEVLAKSFECTIWQNFVPLVGYIYIIIWAVCLYVRLSFHL